RRGTVPIGRFDGAVPGGSTGTPGDTPGAIPGAIPGETPFVQGQFGPGALGNTGPVSRNPGPSVTGKAPASTTRAAVVPCPLHNRLKKPPLHAVVELAQPQHRPRPATAARVARRLRNMA